MTRFVDAMLEPALWFVADWSLRWAVLITVLAVMLWIVRPHRAALRQLLLWVVLAGGLLLPFTPRWGDGWQRKRKESAPPPQSSPLSRDREGARKAPLPNGRGSTDAPRSERLPSNVPSHEETTPPHPAEALGSRRLIVLSLVVCWSFAVASLLIRRLCGWRFLRRLRREAVDVADEADLLSACRAELDVRCRVRLATHPRVRSPILFGLFRPLILVPCDWLQLPPEARRAALLHELAHVRRRDHWLAPLLEIMRIAFFFHPLVRWLLSRLEYERELLCDEMVVRLGIAPRDYARLLLEFARASGRLAWSAASLPMSRRRTVKGRIHHLLEENMERWIRPLPIRWAVVLGTSLLTLTLGLASYRVLAVEKEKAEIPTKKTKEQPASNKLAAAPIKREDLRYGGKDFHQWRRELLTELKPAIRADGLTALGTFGVNGYGAEATQAILEMMRGYDPDIAYLSGKEDGMVVEAGYEAIEKVGAAAVPALTAAVKEENRNVRRFAIKSLGRIGSDAQRALPPLLQAFKNDDGATKMLAIDAVVKIDRGSKEVVAALIEMLNNKNKDVRIKTLTALGGIGEPAKPAIAALLRMLSDKDATVRTVAIHALKQVRAGAKAVLAISRLLHDKNIFVRREAFRYLDSSKPEEITEAVPALIAALKDPDGEWPVSAVIQLKRIGPAAKEAIPALTKLLQTDDGILRVNIMQALKKIGPDDKR